MIIESIELDHVGPFRRKGSKSGPLRAIGINVLASRRMRWVRARFCVPPLARSLTSIPAKNSEIPLAPTSRERSCANCCGGI